MVLFNYGKDHTTEYVKGVEFLAGTEMFPPQGCLSLNQPVYSV